MDNLHDIRHHMYSRTPLTVFPQIFERDEKSKEKAPEVIKKEMEDTKTAPTDSTAFANIFALGQMQNIADGGHGNDPVEVGHKHGLPELPLPPTSNLHHRYDPVVDQVTNLLMKHGKLSVAQRVGSSVSLFSHSVPLLHLPYYQCPCWLTYFGNRTCHSF
jgi:hypothetical protein